jgi:hypothetical protein
MNRTKKVWITLGLVGLLAGLIVISVGAVGGAAFTTYNAHVDGNGKDVCKNSAINCNIYGAKEYVWLNGGPDANILKEDGEYFFAVLEPGGQPNPNDQGAVADKNLSDDYDCYLNRIFTITDGEVYAYDGDASCPAPYDTFTDPHWLDSGEKESNPDVAPNGLPPYIRLFPYSDTTNPGGVYILAICRLDGADQPERGLPGVDPRDCKYDAFKVREGKMDYSFYLSGVKFSDLDAGGDKDEGEPGLAGWTITIKGTDPYGDPIDVEVVTGENGFWEWQSPTYTFNGKDLPLGVSLEVCEVQQDGWTQSFPSEGYCYPISFVPTGFDEFLFLDFGNFKEDLDVSKTAVTYYERRHFWDIDKSVDTEYGFTHDELPKIWLYVDGRYDETATWTVDVTYKGYEDFAENVSGDITIENTGTVTAVITDVEDLLGGTEIAVDCGETFAYPYELAAGATLTCTYDEDGYVEGSNVATVTTERDTYSGSADIIWGDPDKQYDETVTIKDISDLFGEVELGTVTAPNDAQFTYSKAFSWADYGADSCGDYVYDNTATIKETGQSASATLKVNVQCYVYESAWAQGSGEGVTATPFCDSFSNWGWTNLIEGPGTYTGWDLWAGAGQCDPSKGLDVGTVDVFYDGDGYVTVEYTLHFPYYILKETHVYVDVDPFPFNASGPTTAPGQYYNASPFGGEDVYVIAHAVVGIPDPTFGP